METKQTRVNIVCDSDFAPDFLRQLANAIEEESVNSQFETSHGCAEITEED